MYICLGRSLNAVRQQMLIRWVNKIFAAVGLIRYSVLREDSLVTDVSRLFLTLHETSYVTATFSTLVRFMDSFDISIFITSW